MASVRNVIVIIGVGGMGMAAARRLGSGRHLILADYSDQTLNKAVSALASDGHNIDGVKVNITDSSSITKLARDAAAMGRIDAIIHTAGVSPALSSSKQIFDIDLVGTANVIDAFLPFVSPGTSMVCISSAIGYSLVGKLSTGLEHHLGNAPAETLLEHSELNLEIAPIDSYAVAKRANHLRVSFAAATYGSKGARINSISPGVIKTPLSQSELDGPGGSTIRAVVEGGALGRIGNPEDIAGAVAFLVGTDSSFVTGVDLLVDGGQTKGGRSLYSTEGYDDI